MGDRRDDARGEGPGTDREGDGDDRSREERIRKLRARIELLEIRAETANFENRAAIRRAIRERRDRLERLTVREDRSEE